MNVLSRWLIAFLGLLMFGFLAGGAWFYHTEKHRLQHEIEHNLEAIASLKVDQITLLVIFGFVTVLIAIIGVMWQRNAKVRFRELLKAETALYESEKRYGVILMSVGDGIIVINPAGRVELMNPVAESLTGWTLAEAAGRPFAEVFHIINKATRARAEDPVRQVLQNGVVVGLANHTVLISRQGTERQIADSAAPIFDDRKNIIGVVLAFRDVTAEYRVREALRESEHKTREAAEEWKRTFDSITDLLFIQDINFTIIKVNKAFADHMKMKPEDLIGKKCYEVFHKRGAPWPGCPFEKTKIDKLSHTEEVDDPNIGIPLLINISPIFNDKGALVGSVHLAKDISERKRVEKELLFKNALLSVQQEVSPDGILAVDSEGRVILYNQRFIEMWGIPADVIVTRSDEHLLQTVFAKLADPEAFLKKVRYLYEHRDETSHDDIALKDDRTFSRHTAPMYGTDKIYYGRIWFFRDITERRKAEEELRLSKKRADLIYKTVPSAIFTVDKEQRMISWNKKAEELTGYTTEEVLGKECHLFTSEPCCNKCCLFAEDVEKPILSQECTIKRKDGQERIISKNADYLKDADGNVIGGIESFEDITERKLAENSLIAAKAKLEETNAKLQEAFENSNRLAGEAQAASLAKGRFVANISHEIRTPLNGIIGICELLLGTRMTPKQKEYAQIINTSAESLLNIINATLDFSKIDAGKVELEQINFHLRTIFEDIISVLAVGAAKKKLELIGFIEPSTPLDLNGDPGHLRQVLFNLIGNAIKFTAEGEIVVKVAPVEEGGSVFGERRSGMRPADSGTAAMETEPRTPNTEHSPSVLLRFTVSDTGIGIPTDKIELLFNAFSQIDDSFTRKFGGTGLGLAISKGLVEQMGGKIGVDSIPGKGSNFWFTVPFTRQKTTAPSSFEPDAYFGGQRILVVDDNETNRTILNMQLQAWGVRVETAASGEKALEKLRLAGGEGQEPFLAIITDQRMPESDGLTLAKKIKAEPEFQDIPLILMTSMILPSELYEEHKHLFAGIILKPVRQSHLYYSLLTALSGEKPEDHLETIPEDAISSVRLRILVAEDNIINQKVICGMLQKMGHATLAVANGRETIHALELARYDLVLMDIQMPEMDGFEAAALIRDPKSNVLDHQVPIIAITAHALEGDREKCLAAGMHGYIPKPVTAKFLADILTDIIANRGIKTFTKETGFVKDFPGPAIFDEKSFAERLMNDQDLMRETIRIFLDDTPRQIRELAQKIKSGDQAAAARITHTLKGSAANVSGQRLCDIAGQIENSCRSADWRQAETLTPRLERQFETLEKAMRDFQKSMK